MYKGCTEIDGNLIINIRGSGGGSGLYSCAFFLVCYFGSRKPFRSQSTLAFLKGGGGGGGGRGGSFMSKISNSGKVIKQPFRVHLYVMFKKENFLKNLAILVLTLCLFLDFRKDPQFLSFAIFET